MAIEDYIIATDQELIGRVQDGDSTAFNRYRDSIYQLYMQRTGGNVDDTNDLLQETFVKVYLNLQRYSSRFTFGQWVYTIARNTFIDYTRRRRDDTVSIDYVGEGIGVSGSLGGPTPEEHLITHQSQVQLEGTFGDSISPMILINAASQSLSVLLKKRFTTFSK